MKFCDGCVAIIKVICIWAVLYFVIFAIDLI